LQDGLSALAGSIRNKAAIAADDRYGDGQVQPLLERRLVRVVAQLGAEIPSGGADVQAQLSEGWVAPGSMTPFWKNQPPQSAEEPGVKVLRMAVAPLWTVLV
jgi:hypothetical protein